MGPGQGVCLSPAPRTLQTLPSQDHALVGQLRCGRHTELVTVTGAIPAALCDAVPAGAPSGTTLSPPSHYITQAGSAQLLIYSSDFLPTQRVPRLVLGDRQLASRARRGTAAVGALQPLTSCRLGPLAAQRRGSRTRGCSDTRAVPEVTSRFPLPWLGSTLVAGQRSPDSEGTRRSSWR